MSKFEVIASTVVNADTEENAIILAGDTLFHQVNDGKVKVHMMCSVCGAIMKRLDNVYICTNLFCISRNPFIVDKGVNIDQIESFEAIIVLCPHCNYVAGNGTLKSIFWSKIHREEVIKCPRCRKNARNIFYNKK